MIIWLCKLLSVLEYWIEPKSYPVAKTCYLLHMNDANLIFIYGMKYIVSQACFLQVDKICYVGFLQTEANEFSVDFQPHWPVMFPKD